MNGRFSLRNVLSIFALTAAWLALWQTISFANIASGLVVSSAVIFAGLGTAGKGSIRPVALLHLLGVVTLDLIQSTASVARAVLSPTDRTDEAVIGIDLPPGGADHLLLFTLAITLTPGTAVIDADKDDGIIYVHLLNSADTQATIAHVHRLVDLANAALPVGSGAHTQEAPA